MDLTKNFNSHIEKVKEGSVEYRRLENPPLSLYELSGKNYIYFIYQNICTYEKK